MSGKEEEVEEEEEECKPTEKPLCKGQGFEPTDSVSRARALTEALSEADS